MVYFCFIKQTHTHTMKTTTDILALSREISTSFYRELPSGEKIYLHDMVVIKVTLADGTKRGYTILRSIGDRDHCIGCSFTSAAGYMGQQYRTYESTEAFDNAIKRIQKLVNANA